MSFNMVALEEHVSDNRPKLNPCQREAYESVMAAIDSRQGGLFFLDGPGGTGKTFVENLLLATVRGRGDIALAVASNGIAALLLEGGRTAHSMFSIPIPCEHNAVCEVEKEGHKAQLFRSVRLIIWDEASMQHRYCYEAVDRMLQDVRDDVRPFGGITILFAGDFRQCLPVVPNGSRGQIVAATLKHSGLWEEVVQLHLEENVRLLGGNLTDNERQRAAEYAPYILRIGDGIECSSVPDRIQLPESMRLENNTLEELIDDVYPGLDAAIPIPEFLAERAILAARNIDVNDLNDSLLDRVPGDEHLYNSIDSVSTEDQQTYPEEYLNSLDINEVPPHKLRLKVGAPIILLRNINPKNGLCNGTRLQVTHLARNVLGGMSSFHSLLFVDLHVANCVQLLF
jgi:ATP-dependent DNA helicase PIF1